MSGLARMIAPLAEARRIVDELRLEAIAESADLAARHARMVATAAKRHDRIVLAMRLRQLRACVKATLETCEEMDREGGR